MSRKLNRGLRHSEINPVGGKWVLSYCYHGSSNIQSKSFDTLEEAQADMAALRAASDRDGAVNKKGSK
tara:strand:+ start:15799 stop:16002 length:204 start_codon:yes stop_codon:yes gene_type:complete